jgi:hypothetical protein
VTKKRSVLISAFILANNLFTPVQAGAPVVYVSSFKISGTLKECLAGARKALVANDMVNISERLTTSKEGGHVDGETRNQDIAASIECTPKQGRSAIAVAGANSKAVYAIYAKLLSSDDW